MSELVERVARAIGDQLYGYCDPNDTPNTWVSAMSAARAAIEAMREPTNAMKDACCGDGWRAMIDAALEDKREDG